MAAKRSLVRAQPEGWLKTLTQVQEKAKARVRAKGEHAFQVIKNRFGLNKVRYRGLDKNTSQLHTPIRACNLILDPRRAPGRSAGLKKINIAPSA